MWEHSRPNGGREKERKMKKPITYLHSPFQAQRPSQGAWMKEQQLNAVKKIYTPPQEIILWLTKPQLYAVKLFGCWVKAAVFKLVVMAHWRPHEPLLAHFPKSIRILKEKFFYQQNPCCLLGILRMQRELSCASSRNRRTSSCTVPASEENHWTSITLRPNLSSEAASQTTMPEWPHKILKHFASSKTTKNLSKEKCSTTFWENLAPCQPLTLSGFMLLNSLIIFQFFPLRGTLG